MKKSEKANRRLDQCRFTSRLLFGAAAICTFALISVTTASADNSSHRPIAFTESGRVIGSTTDGGNEFLGIPYAAPPVGALRWRAPKRYGFFPGFVLQATQFGSACTQPGGIGSENCLFLNVYTPQTELVWSLYDYTIETPSKHTSGRGMMLCRKSENRWYILGMHESPIVTAVIPKP